MAAVFLTSCSGASSGALPGGWSSLSPSAHAEAVGIVPPHDSLAVHGKVLAASLHLVTVETSEGRKIAIATDASTVMRGGPPKTGEYAQAVVRGTSKIVGLYLALWPAAPPSLSASGTVTTPAVDGFYLTPTGGKPLRVILSSHTALSGPLLVGDSVQATGAGTPVRGMVASRITVNSSPTPSAEPSITPSPGASPSPTPSSTASSAPTPSPSATPSPTGSSPPGYFHWVIVIDMENRSFDNLFNGFPGANTSNSCVVGTTTVPLVAEPLQAPGDIDHEHSDFVAQYDGGNMDGFGEQVGTYPQPTYPSCEYVPSSDTPQYWTIASTYAIGDNTFQSNQGASFPSHEYLGAGGALTNTPGVYVETNPSDDGGGCNSASTSTVATINLTTGVIGSAYPCFTVPTLFAEMNAATLPSYAATKVPFWKFYQPEAGPGLLETPGDFTGVVSAPTYAKNAVYPNTLFFSDVAKGDLAPVSYVIPTSVESDHPNATNGTGPAWVAEVINAIGESQYWNRAVIFITWDDWGGFFDHVKPPIYNAYELGFRVPFIVVSPYACAGYVSHVQHENNGTIDHFIEENFGLASLNASDARADDAADMFCFTQTPLTFIPIPGAMTPAQRERQARHREIPDY